MAQNLQKASHVWPLNSSLAMYAAMQPEIVAEPVFDGIDGEARDARMLPNTHWPATLTLPDVCSQPWPA